MVMEVKTTKNNINFGWNYRTHKRVTGFALEDFPKLKPFKKNLEEFVQKPDFDEKGLLNNWHFCFKKKMKTFLYSRLKDNAYTKYMEHVTNMIMAADEKNIDSCIEHAGRAMHFLQDVAQPHHTHKNSACNKIFQYKDHVNFENFARENQQKYFDDFAEKPTIDISFKDIFLKNLNFSTEIKLPTKINKTEWDSIGKNSINQAILSTKEFLAKLESLILQKN